MSPASATPTTIAVTQSMGATSLVARVEKSRHSSPPGSRRDEGYSPSGATPHSARGPEPEDSCTPPGLTSRSAPIPTSPSPTPGKPNERQGCLGGLALPRTPETLRPTDTKIGGDTVENPDTCGAAIPSAICSIADGVAISCVSPRSNPHGCARQLAVATQYLNRSLLVPTPPHQPTGSSSSSSHVRPATAGAETDSIHTGRGFVAGRGCNRIDSRPRTTSAGQQERSRHNPPLDGRTIWRSSLPGGDDRGRDLATSALSSRPLTSSRAASKVIGSPTRGKGSSTQRSPRKLIVVSPPAKVGRGGTRGIAPSESAFRLDAPEPAQGGLSLCEVYDATPRQRLRPQPPVGDFEAGVQLTGESGYTASTASEPRGVAFHKDGRGDATAGHNIPELFVPSPSSATIGERTFSDAAAAIPQLQLDHVQPPDPCYRISR